MTQAQASALAKMHAANAALTPEQRKARSEAANKAAKRKAVGPFPQGASRAAQPPAPRTPVDMPVVEYVFTSTWKREDTDVEALVTVPVAERTVRRAIKQGRKLAREQAPEGTTWGGFVGLVRADAVSLDFTQG
jgi:hypothetical protein